MREPRQSVLQGTLLPVLPHELAFNAFLVLMIVRLAVRAPFAAPVSLFLLNILIGAGLIVWCNSKPTPWRWRIRALWYMTGMGLAYYSLPSAIHLLGVAPADSLLAAWDVALLGGPATTLFAAWQTPLLTDAMVIAYLFFFYYLLFGPIYYAIHDLPRLRSCCVGLFTLYAIGFVGYTLLPAGGPHLLPEASIPEGGWLTHEFVPWINAGSNRIDVFPSIHVAVSLYLLVFDAWHHRRRFWLLALPCIALWVSTVYLGYHYLVDLVGALVIAMVGLGVAWMYERSRLARETDLLAAAHVQA